MTEIIITKSDKKNKVDNYIGLDHEELNLSVKYYYIGF